MLANCGDAEAAAVALESIINADARPTAACYLVVICTHARAGKTGEAEKWLNALIDSDLDKPTGNDFGLRQEWRHQQSQGLVREDAQRDRFSSRSDHPQCHD